MTARASGDGRRSENMGGMSSHQRIHRDARLLTSPSTYCLNALLATTETDASWLTRAARILDDLRDCLAHIERANEGDGGRYEHVLQVRPELCGAVRQARHEHAALLRDSSSLRRRLVRSPRTLTSVRA